MHDKIRRFSSSGVVAEANVLSTKENLIHFWEKQMKDCGCLPSLDLDPQFTLDYQGDGTFKFELTVYGVTTDIEGYSGVSNGKRL